LPQRMVFSSLKAARPRWQGATVSLSLCRGIFGRFSWKQSSMGWWGVGGGGRRLTRDYSLASIVAQMFCTVKSEFGPDRVCQNGLGWDAAEGADWRGRRWGHDRSWFGDFHPKGYTIGLSLSLPLNPRHGIIIGRLQWASGNSSPFCDSAVRDIRVEPPFAFLAWVLVCVGVRR